MLQTGIWRTATWRRLRRDERGSIEAMSYIFMVPIVGIGMICGLSTVRDQLSQAFGDVADAVLSFDQSYTVTMTFAQIGGGTTVKTFGYVGNPGVTQTAGTGPGDMPLCQPATDEN